MSISQFLALFSIGCGISDSVVIVDNVLLEMHLSLMAECDLKSYLSQYFDEGFLVLWLKNHLEV